MAVQTPPFVLQNSSHGSELVRREALASLVYGSAGGVVPATPAASANLTAGVAGCSDLKVNAPASGMSCLLNSGQVYVPGTLGSGSGYGIGTGYGMPTVTLNGGAAPTVAATARATAVQLTTQGVYYCYNDNSGGQVSLTVAASNATNPRIDVVIAQVEDASYSGSNNDWKLAVVTGTAAASPTIPSLPANAVVLAYLWIPAASTSVTAGNILDLRYACNRNPFRATVQMNAASWSAAFGAVIALDTVVSDIAGMWNATNHNFVTPIPAVYDVVGSIYGTTASAGAGGVGLQLNGAAYRNGTYLNPCPTSAAILQVIAQVRTTNVGDTIALVNNSSVGWTGGNGSLDTWCELKMASPL